MHFSFSSRNDKRFFLKTQNKREVQFLLSNLRIYMEHLEKYPHSLLVKFLGKTQDSDLIVHWPAGKCVHFGRGGMDPKNLRGYQVC